MARTISDSLGSESRNSGDSLWLPGTVTNGAMMLKSRPRKTTLPPLKCLCPLYPRLSPPFFAAVVVPSPRMTERFRILS